MVGKRILPWFGGAPAVWTLCLAFYQTTLFAGYAYAHALIRYARPALQLPVHFLVCGAALLALPVLPPDAWRPAGAVEPGAAILSMLAVHVAPPFLALAATGPLVQAWFARRYPSRSPYPLYAVSNLGSFLALVAYPFVVEPRLPLSRTGELWSQAFVATALAVLACAALARSAAPGTRSPATGALATERSAPSRVALWFLLPGCAVVLLMGVTHSLTLDVASVPFLWVLPLGIYLATFVLCFGSGRAYRRLPCLLLAGIPLLAQWAIEATDPGQRGALASIFASLQVQVVVHSLLLFASCMLLHGELYRIRPPASSLTAFYLCLSAGGALGGIFAGAVAPWIFDDYREQELALALGWLLLLWVFRKEPRGWLSRTAPPRRWALVLALTALLLPYGAYVNLRRPEEVVHQERGFFGVLRVWQTGEGTAEQRQLWNGTTLHGVQFPAMPRRATSYFGVQTGIGLALGQPKPDSPPVSIAVIGLGIGTLAAYARAGDRIRFYEIDPAVVHLARDPRYFTYLTQSPAEIEVVEGDARISFAAERAGPSPPRFDFLIVDAFSSDAIPVHLLTREALALYLDALSDTGLLAFHVSNRHFDLVPVLARLGADAGLRAAAIETSAIPGHRSAQSTWMFLARNDARIRPLVRLAAERRRQLGLSRAAIRAFRPSADALAATPLWTDDYSDLLGALRPLRTHLLAR